MKFAREDPAVHYYYKAIIYVHWFEVQGKMANKFGVERDSFHQKQSVEYVTDKDLVCEVFHSKGSCDLFTLNKLENALS